MKSSNGFLFLVLVAALILSCTKKEAAAPVPGSPVVVSQSDPSQPDKLEVKPPPPLVETGMIVDSDVEFVTWGDEIQDDAQTNPVMIEATGPQEVRVRYHFRVDVSKFVRILSVRPSLLTCQGADTAETTLSLIQNFKESTPVDFNSMIPVEPGIDYAIEVHQNLECEKISGIYEVILWSGKHTRIDPALATLCRDDQGEMLTLLESDRPVLLIGKEGHVNEKPLLSPKVYCGRAVPSEKEATCTRKREGSNQIFQCETQVAEEKSSFQISMDPIHRTGSLACKLNDQITQQMNLQSCKTKVVDKLDYSSAP